MLCGTLIVTFPNMLDLTLGHAENMQEPFIAYGLLAGATSLFVGLIAAHVARVQSYAQRIFRGTAQVYGEHRGQKTQRDNRDEKRRTLCHRATKSTTGIGARHLRS